MQAMQGVVTRRHGGLGVTSFILGILSVFLVAGFFGFAGYASQTGQQTEQVNLIAGIMILLLFGMSLLGIGLGIGGAASRTSKKVFPVFGIVLCAAAFLIAAGLVGLGTLMMRHGG
jgi:hypothetical protein